ncbi:glycoside hydrolase family 38 C-terminal domain-containing protein [Streptomyces sp. H10-C2]|uniref:alpha-mannosidase n=1 Tax=unclassified Streptomyces TaxID=2593676 RepID=UPI0024B8B336|nr:MULTISPECIES: glycoside hydrolase family 38 C-terminal domain-containing protein [unclassified Streptomyces]MDJ0340736.1 glycoside hydrolase family 38 C-terminal domain-containing protein [Streptomyces sp. PH10-H1]MDJ0371992.1 glycoside hydrolase family 38 C-terminal domain-containing protein [Streptomyces sp. H10-C2]
MHDDRQLVEGRLDRAVAQFIRPAQYAARVPLSLSVWHVPGEPVPVEQALKGGYEPFAPGTDWGTPWSTSWFRLEGTVPQSWVGQRVEAVIDPGFSGDGPGFQAEGLVYDAGGVPIKGIHPANRHVPVTGFALGGEPVHLLLEAAANPAVLHDFSPTLLGDVLTAGDRPLYRFASADLAVLDEQVWHLLLDIEVLSELMGELAPHEPRRHEILRALETMLDTLDLHQVHGTAPAARAELVEVLSRPAHASAHRISATGHAHIDSAWLWPLRETVRKASRTFANVTALAQDYPELVFACSQAQQYAWVKEHQPHIWRRIQRAVRDGSWAPVGSMWVESDANMPGGEALARQLVHGKRFFLDELGVETEEVWLPDSFGYTAAFPQLAELAGVRWFLTQKLSWNQTNKMPHHTFWWEGIDGTRVFTHFPPVDTYNSRFAGHELSRAVRNFAEKGRATRSLVPFGWGDGGGGPTREMMEKARRLRSLEGSPRVEIEKPAAFFAAAEREYAREAPVWSGEMYLELHRATYTTQAKTKQGNRRSEHLLREAELWATAAALHNPSYGYPYDGLDRIWKTVLLHQFHDILPGSSIAWVHREARDTYERVRAELSEITASAVRALGGGGAAVLNASPYGRDEVVELDAAALPDGAAAQPLPGGRAAVAVRVPALGSATVAEAGPEPAPVSVTVRDGSHILDNGLLRVVVDPDGLLASVTDLTAGPAGREVLPPGTRGNLLQLHPDHPNKWDAWDIDRHYRRRRTDLTAAESVGATASGPLLAVVRTVRAFGASRVRQDIRLRAGSKRLDFVTEVDWHESEKVLKAAFPVDVHADRSASEIQFGHVFRPTHTNTSWDAARFEICAHRWVRVAEPGYGVAVLNDSTYGHDVNRTVHSGRAATTVRLTLLRAPHSPDPETDQGTHRFTYALLPGAGTGDAVAEGLALNLPLLIAEAPASPSLVSADHPGITVEAVKLADDRSGDVMVRLYESRGGRAAGTLSTGFPVADAQVTDLLERPLRAAERTAGGGVALELRPFQILTLRLRPGPGRP